MKKKHLQLKNHVPSIIAGVMVLSTAFFAGCKKSNNYVPPAKSTINSVNHVVVIYMENHSFDNLYGQFAGANGLQNANASNTTQVDATGTPYTFLPAIPGTPVFPTNLANGIFNIDQYVPNDQITQDVLHRYYQEQMQI